MLDLTFPSIGTTDEQLPLDLNDQPEPMSARERRWRAFEEHAYHEAMRRAVTPEEQAEIQRFFDETLAEGPGGYRRGSISMEAPKLSIDRNAIARIRFALEMIERKVFRANGRAGHDIPPCMAKVLRALLDKARFYGRLYPTLERIADWARVRSKTTVCKALDLLVEYGFVVRHRRRKMTVTMLGTPIEVQASNAYEVQEPPNPADTLKRTAQNHRKTPESSFRPRSSQPHLLKISSERARGGAGVPPTPDSASGEAAKEAAGDLSLPAAPPQPIISAELAALVARWRR
jgi:hypothetical protein